jgi:hypothetical protein
LDGGLIGAGHEVVIDSENVLSLNSHITEKYFVEVDSV